MIQPAVTIIENKVLTDFEKGPIRRSLFSNGAVSLFQHYPGMTSASVALYFMAGSIHEQKGQEGIVHMIEHMLFKEGKESEIVKQLEFQGADINAFTYKEFVCFEMECAAEKLTQFLPLFLKLFFSPVFKEQDLALEKKVVMQELRDELDDHESFGHDYILKRSFGPELGHSIGGSEKTVGKFKAQDLHDFFETHFTANKMVLSICSGKPQNKVETLFSKAMGEVARFCVPGKPVRYKCKNSFSSPPVFKRALKRKIENAVYFLAIGGPSIESKYYFDLAVMDELFFEGLSSKFYQELREKYALLYGLGSVINSFHHTGLYVMIFNGQQEKIPEIKKRIKALLHYHREQGFDPAEVEMVKARMIDGSMRGFDALEERNEYVAMRELYGHTTFSVEKELASIRKVTPRRLKSLLTKMLEPGAIELTIMPQ